MRKGRIYLKKIYFYSLAGTFAAVLTCPLEVIKTRYQSSQNAFSQETTHLNLKSSMSNTTSHHSSSGYKRPTIMGSLRYI
jgi:hypothetical protein